MKRCHCKNDAVKDLRQRSHFGVLFFKQVVTIKVSDIASHFYFKPTNQPSLLNDCNLLIYGIVRVCGALECLLGSDGKRRQ